MRSLNWQDLLGTAMAGRDILYYTTTGLLLRGPIRTIMPDPDDAEHVIVEMQWSRLRNANAKPDAQWQPSGTTVFRLRVMHLPETNSGDGIVFRTGKGRVVAQIMESGNHIA